jgi:hypothetical protein
MVLYPEANPYTSLYSSKIITPASPTMTIHDQVPRRGPCIGWQKPIENLLQSHHNTPDMAKWHKISAMIIDNSYCH